MKPKQIRLLFAIIGASVFLGQTSRALPIVQDSFAYPGTGQLGSTLATGGGGSIPGWANPQTTVTFTNGIGSLDGTSLGLVASAGDMVSISGTAVSGLGCYNKFVPSGAFPQPGTGEPNTNLYYSFLYRFNVGSDVSTTGQIISQVNRENSGFATGVHWYLIAKRTGANIQLGIAKGVASVTNYSPANIVAGQTFFVVIQQVLTNGAANDIDSLWINPPKQYFGTNENNIPPADASVSLGTEDASTTGPGRFWIASGANANLDELRISTNWADVTPWVGQCLPPVIVSSPASVTNVAEINAAFSVVASGTSLTYQWQLNQRGNSSWANISGATDSSYTTPNLNLTNDNGDEYRVIATAPCSGLMATSGVAKVTLTAPVVTAVGTIMDDFFENLVVDALPISSTNSVWFTETAADLSAYPGPGMTATPTSGSSSLWLGYFIYTNQLPVDLAVGNAIKVTLPFTPTGFTAHTNNAALRFGLFDYYDGGVYVVNDDSTVGGSTGNGAGVRGYMLSVDFGPNFTSSSPLSLLTRIGLTDNNLMGTTGDYLSMGGGPSGGGYSNAPAFVAGTQYTLVFTVTRTDVNTCTFGATITGGGTNWSFSVTDTNGYAYHRFDSFAIRPNSLETSADTFFIPEFKVEVVAAPVTPSPISLAIQPSGANVVLSWTNPSSSTFTLQASGTVNGTYTNVTTTTPYTTAATGAQTFYRLIWQQP